MGFGLFVLGMVSYFSASPDALPSAPVRDGFSLHSVAGPDYRVRLPWKGFFSSSNFVSPEEKQELSDIKALLQDTLRTLPDHHADNLQELSVENVEHPSRGLANSKKIILNIGHIKSDAELVAVFVHELGHVVDLGYLKGEHGADTAFRNGRNIILSDDLSVRFYGISWQDSTTRLQTSQDADFVSGYARSSAFEDFAESYTFYRLHGEKFRAAVEGSDALRRKYNFLRWQVFGGQEFQTEKLASTFEPGNIWDTTLLPYQLGEFLARE